MVMKSEMCAAFAKNTESLFRLSYLITGEQSKAESCFAQALDVAIASAATVVSSDFVLSWAKRVVIKASINTLSQNDLQEEMASRALDPASLEDQLLEISSAPPVPRSRQDEADAGWARDPLGEGLLSLKPLLRVAFVLRYLERLSKRDIALLLDVSPTILNRALQSALVKLAACAGPRFLAFSEHSVNHPAFSIPQTVNG